MRHYEAIPRSLDSSRQRYQQAGSHIPCVTAQSYVYTATKIPFDCGRFAQRLDRAQRVLLCIYLLYREVSPAALVRYLHAILLEILRIDI